MDMNKFEKEIQEKLHSRKIQPSASAWERLSSQLDAKEMKKKRGWFLYIGYAASIAIIISIVLFLKDNGANETAIPENTIVTKEVKVPEIDKKQFKDATETNEVIVTNEIPKKVEKKKEPILRKKPFKKQMSVTKDESVIAKKEAPKKVVIPKKKIDIKTVVKEETAIATSKPLTKKLKKEPKFKKPEGTISVSSDALLYAVTHSKEEIRGYYKKYKISRADVLKTIEKELKKTKLKIDPNTILAEVERDVNEESFKNNFYRLIKKRVSDVATAIANRNN